MQILTHSSGRAKGMSNEDGARALTRAIPAYCASTRPSVRLTRLPPTRPLLPTQHANSSISSTKTKMATSTPTSLLRSTAASWVATRARGRRHGQRR